MKTAFNLLQNSQETKDLFSKSPRVVFKKPANIKQMLVCTDPLKKENKESQSFGCKPCQKPRCGTCKIMSTSQNFKREIVTQQDEHIQVSAGAFIKFCFEHVGINCPSVSYTEGTKLM
ncbi:hypothetical protein J6590_087155 [Homalodisca vitripennis]|nr:hypothetical protein J6590_087155 [Homalodisca vitripennis]